MKTKQQIDEQVTGLLIEKAKLLKRIGSTPNTPLPSIDAQIAILSGCHQLDYFEEGTSEYISAKAAQDWLDGENNDNLFLN